MASAGDVLAGRYRIDGRLGAGGMATVYRARDLLLGRDVAVKVLAPNIAARPTVLERFGREARALAALNHPNIVAIHDVGWADEDTGHEPFLVMELVPGGSLAQELAAHGRLAPPAVARLVDGLASALAALHRAGIVHRDVKPQNVLLAPAGPKLADLGVIRLEDESDELAALTASGETLGTLRYLAPEVLYGQAAGPKADAFSLALVAFEALTGRSPRPAVTVGDLVDAAWQPPPLVSETEPSLGTSFDAVFAAALDLDPNRRLDALGFATALREAVTAPGLPAPPRSPAVIRDDAPTELVPTPIATRRTGIGAMSRPREPQSHAGLPAIAAVIGMVVIGAAVLFALYPRLFAGATGSVQTGPPSPLTGSAPSEAAESVSPSPSPTLVATPSPSPSPSVSPSPVPLDAAFFELRAEISAARGNGGLKGGEAKDLEKAVDEIERAVEKGDFDKATSLAEDLATQIDRLIDKGEIGGVIADRLRAASRDLLRLLETG